MKISQLSVLIISILVVIAMTILLYTNKVNETAGVALITLCLSDIYSIVEQLIISRNLKGSDK